MIDRTASRLWVKKKTPLSSFRASEEYGTWCFQRDATLDCVSHSQAPNECQYFIHGRQLAPSVHVSMPRVSLLQLIQIVSGDHSAHQYYRRIQLLSKFT